MLVKSSDEGEASLVLFFSFEIEGRQANVKAQEAVDHLAGFLLSIEEISQSGIEPATSSLRFGYLSNIIL